MRVFSSVLVVCVLSGCQPPTNDGLTPYSFIVSSRQPRVLTANEIDAAARSGLRANEKIASVGMFRASGIGHTIVQVVAESPRNARAYVVDEDGLVLPTNEFWAKERAARRLRFGKMSPELFEYQQALTANTIIDVDIMIAADVPQPQRPYDGTDQYRSKPTRVGSPRIRRPSNSGSRQRRLGCCSYSRATAPRSSRTRAAYRRFAPQFRRRYSKHRRLTQTTSCASMQSQRMHRSCWATLGAPR